MRNTVILVMALLSACLIESSADAVVLSFQEGVGGYSSTLDTWIESANTANNNGSSTVISIDGVGGTDNTPGTREGLVQFGDIFGWSAGQIPLGSTINSATLTVFVSNAGHSAVGVHRMLSNWDESITYASAFGGDGIDADGSEAIAAATDTLAMNTTNNYRTADVTADLALWAAGSANNRGWAFLQSPDNPGNFDSRENLTAANRPELSVDFTPPPVPEPSTFGMLFGCTWALIRRKSHARQE